ncbi:Ribokinase-like protein [Xylariaceae sp. FL0255]|nr:Ribokinase-like protein [Xylariaceae sp. FL0255]
MTSKMISIIGGLDADLIMIANRIPDRGESVLANEYLEALGGKGANSAIATYRTCHQKRSEATGDDDARSTDHSQAESTNNIQEAPRVAWALSEPLDDYKDDIQVKMIGAVGDDHYGAKFIQELNKNGVDTSGIVTVRDTNTSVCFVMVEQQTRENRCLFTLGATAVWRKEDFTKPEDLGGGVRPDLIVAQMEIEKSVVETMLETAHRSNIDFCLNAAPAVPLSQAAYRHITHLLVNESEAAILFGCDRDEVNESTWSEIAQEFLRRGVKNVVITLGAKGAYFANAEESDRCLAYVVEVLDTTGAGDTFTGAYASSYVRQKATGRWDIREAVIRANKAAAIAIGSMSAQAGIPWEDEIDGFQAPLLKSIMDLPRSDC